MSEDSLLLDILELITELADLSEKDHSELREHIKLVRNRIKEHNEQKAN